nr:MAG TPA: hypothetical protein [Bacteriophage sp.]
MGEDLNPTSSFSYTRIVFRVSSCSLDRQFGTPPFNECPATT